MLTPDDEARFTNWWAQVEEDILAIGRWYLGSQSAAEDGAQDVAYAAITNFSSFRNLAHFSAWTKTRTRWLALGSLRIRKREIPATDSGIDLASVIIEEPGDVETGERVEQERQLLAEAIDRLPPRQRKVMIRKLEGHATKKIAHELRIKLSTVRSLYRHARFNLSVARSISQDVEVCNDG